MLIDRKLYPQLDSLLWDQHGRYIRPDHAIQMYETRWRYVDHPKITPSEQALINDLTTRYCGGVFMPAI
ncbi:MAG: hypothetical protein GY833_12675 [Aestuariibacter sp.]|nr:hypothetical protein [Aestuariibacter sp.]